MIEAGNCYEAQQMYKALSARCEEYFIVHVFSSLYVADETPFMIGILGNYCLLSVTFSKNFIDVLTF